MMKQSGMKFVLAGALFSAAFALSGCPDQGLVCHEGMTACNNSTCEDLQNDNHNCGGCGISCQTGQICRAGACECAPGTTECNGECVVTDTDPRNCGSCGNACSSVEVCEKVTNEDTGEAKVQCETSCSVNAVQCGQSCVNLKTDDNHCGACDTVCSQGQSCHQGVCSYDVVLACFTTGQVVGLQNGTGVRGALQPLASAPQALAVFGKDVLLSADGFDNKLYESNLSTFAPLRATSELGMFPNQVLVDGDYVYVTNSGNGSVAVLHAESVVDADAGVGSQGVTFAVVNEVSFGDNSYPQVMTKVGDSLFVTLYGGFDEATLGAGQKVVEVDVKDPAKAAIKSTTDLSGLALPFDPDGGTQSIPRPQGITSRNGKLYVALNNLDPTYAVAGPAYVATFPGSDGGTSAIELPQDKCLNATWARTVGDKVLVSCAGQAKYDSNFKVTEVKGSGLVVIDADDTVASAVAVSCPEDSDAGCTPPSLTRFGVAGNTVYAGDQSSGRLYVFGLQGNQLTQQGTWAKGAPVDVCPANETTGFSNLSDVLVVP